MKATEIIYGIHTINGVLQHNPQRILKITTTRHGHDKRLQKLLSLAKHHGIAVEWREREALDDLAQGAVHQNILATCASKGPLQQQDLEALLTDCDQPFLLVLDGVQDPHNLGACLRSADGAGVDGVITPKDNAVGLTHTVQKVAAGASETVPLFQVTNLARTLRYLKQQNLWVFGLTDDASTDIYHADLRGPLALVLGAEHKGIRPLVRDHCDALYRIPMEGHVSSLNVSVATGVCLYEALRQRRSIK